MMMTMYYIAVAMLLMMACTAQSVLHDGERGTGTHAKIPASQVENMREPGHNRKKHILFDEEIHKQEYAELRAKIKEHTEVRGGAFAGKIPEHLLEHFAKDEF